MATPRQMLFGFIVGLLGGLITYALTGGEAAGLTWVMTYITGPMGELFLRLLMMLVLPLVFSALVVAVATMRDVSQLAVLGRRMGVFTALSTGLAVTVGIVLMRIFQPGVGFDEALSSALIESSASRVGEIVEAGASSPGIYDLLLGMVPTNILGAVVNNDILAVLFVALFLGVALVLTPGPGAETVIRGVEGLFDVSMRMIHWVIGLAPVAVACLVFNSVAVFGWELLVRLGGFVGVTMLGFGIHFFVFYPLMLWFSGKRPWAFAKASRKALLMAFSTSSSSATLPTTLHVAEDDLKMPPRITRFVVTIGATANQNGTALFEGVTVLFLAQLAGVDLSIAQQIVLMLVCVLGGIGTAGIPAGSLPVIAMICLMFNIPPEGIGIILGVDRFLDMCRTTVNVAGDLVASAFLHRWEQLRDGPQAPELSEPLAP